MAVVNEHPAWLVFFGTLTTIVRAADEHDAYWAFINAYRPDTKMGRIMAPTPDEVTIRRPILSDRKWIEDSHDARFIALLPELVDA